MQMDLMVKLSQLYLCYWISEKECFKLFYANDGTYNSSISAMNFSQIGKDLQLIMEKIVTNDQLAKLLYYGEKDAVKKENLSADIKLSMVNDYVRVVPVLPKDLEAKNYIIVQFDNFSPNPVDAMIYKEFLLTFDVFCNAQNWILDDYQLRPYAIMNELDKMFNLSKLNSSGPINFVGANHMIINENLLGFSLVYRVHDYR